MSRHARDPRLCASWRQHRRRGCVGVARPAAPAGGGAAGRSQRTRTSPLKRLRKQAVASPRARGAGVQTIGVRVAWRYASVARERDGARRGRGQGAWRRRMRVGAEGRRTICSAGGPTPRAIRAYDIHRRPRRRRRRTRASGRDHHRAVDDTHEADEADGRCRRDKKVLRGQSFKTAWGAGAGALRAAAARADQRMPGGGDSDAGCQTHPPPDVIGRVAALPNDELARLVSKVVVARAPGGAPAHRPRDRTARRARARRRAGDPRATARVAPATRVRGSRSRRMPVRVRAPRDPRRRPCPPPASRSFGRCSRIASTAATSSSAAAASAARASSRTAASSSIIVVQRCWPSTTRTAFRSRAIVTRPMACGASADAVPSATSRQSRAQCSATQQ